MYRCHLTRVTLQMHVLLQNHQGRVRPQRWVFGMLDMAQPTKPIFEWVANREGATLMGVIKTSFFACIYVICYVFIIYNNMYFLQELIPTPSRAHGDMLRPIFYRKNQRMQPPYRHYFMYICGDNGTRIGPVGYLRDSFMTLLGNIHVNGKLTVIFITKNFERS